MPITDLPEKPSTGQVDEYGGFQIMYLEDRWTIIGYTSTPTDSLTERATKYTELKNYIYDSLTVEANGASVMDEFSSYSNGAPTVLRKGGKWVMWDSATGRTNGPIVTNGKLTSSTPTSAGAGYAQVELSTTITKVGGRFTFSTKSTDAGSAVFIAWADDVGVNWPNIPDSPCHLAITPTNAIYGVWSGGVFTQLIDWTFDTALTCDGATVYTVEVFIDKATSTATCFLPDGSVRTITDSRIDVDAKWACWEYFRIANTDPLAAFTEIWASNRSFDNDGLVKWAGNLPVLLTKATTYAPATNQDKAVTTSPAAVDSTNLKLSITGPPSGKILIKLCGYLSMSGSTRVFWAVTSGATTYATTNVVGQQFTGLVTMEYLITGLTYNLPYVFIWNHFALANSTATFLLDAPNGYTATMVATPLAS